MSDSSADSFETARDRAKEFLKRARAGDASVIAQLKKLLPKISDLDNATISTSIKLADVQHAVARSTGRASWAELKKFFHDLDPLHLKAGRFLTAIYKDKPDEARRMLAETPAIGTINLFSAAAAGNAAAIVPFIAEAKDQQPALDDALVHVCRSFAIEPHASCGVECANLLLDAGASPNASIPFEENSTPLSALFYCCWTNKPLVARLLLERGADTQDGESIYHAAEKNHRECLEVLKEFGADFSEAQSPFDNTPLFFLAGYSPFDSACAPSERGMQWLLENGADPNVPSYTKKKFPEAGSAPLHRLAANGRSVEIISKFLNHHAVVDAKRNDGKTPYALALRSGNVATAELLIARGADPSLVTESDRFIAACMRGDRTEAAQIINSNPNLMTNASRADGDALLAAITRNALEGVRLMIDAGFDVHSLADEQATPLHWAAWHGKPEIAKLLIERGAPINVRDKTFGSSPIAWAAHGSTHGPPSGDSAYVEIVNVLIHAGAEREVSINKWGEPPESMSSKAVADALRVSGFVA